MSIPPGLHDFVVNVNGDLIHVDYSKTYKIGKTASRFLKSPITSKMWDIHPSSVQVQVSGPFEKPHISMPPMTLPLTPQIVSLARASNILKTLPGGPLLLLLNVTSV